MGEFTYGPIQEMARNSEKCWLNTPTTTTTWVRMAGADVTEEGVAVVVEGNVFPLEGGKGGSAGGQLRILLL